MLEAQKPTFALMLEEPCERLLKTWFPDVYRSDNYMDYYNFCQECEDHFTTVGAKRSNRIFFTTFFLCDRINLCW